MGLPVKIAGVGVFANGVVGNQVSFSMSLNWKGQLSWDSYEDRVLSGENTADRINKEYRAATEAIFTSPAFPYYSHIEFGDIEFNSREWVETEGLPGYALFTEDLELEYPKPVDDSPRKEGRVETMEFLYDDIYEEGMVQRVNAANEAAIAHHAKADAENEKWIESMKEE